MSSTTSDSGGGGEQDLEMAEAVAQIKRAYREQDGEALERVGLWVTSQGRQMKKEGQNE